MSIDSHPQSANSPRTRPIVVSIVGAKGGTLKTATAASLARLLAERAYDATLVDLDPQATLTLRSGFERVRDPIFAPAVALKYHLRGHEEFVTAGAVTLIRGGREMVNASAYEVAAHIGRASRAATPGALAFVIIDTPPALASHTQEAMRAADIILVPTDPTSEGLQGLVDVLELHTLLQLGSPIRAVLTKVTGRFSAQNAWARQELSSKRPFSSVSGLRCAAEIPLAKAGAESASFELPVTVTAPSDPVSVAYRKLAMDLGSALGIALRRRRVPVRAATPVMLGVGGAQ